MRWLVGCTLAVLLVSVVATTAGNLVSDTGPAAAPQASRAAAPGTTTTVTLGTAPSAPGVGAPPVETTAPTAVPSFSPVEIAAHATTASCWLVVDGRVFDVTDYLRSHPGGSKTITPWCGKESTEAFATEDGRGEHSPAAYHELARYEIGVMAG